MTPLFAFGLAALATYVLRSCMTMWGDQLLESDQFTFSIALVSPAVLSAIVASAVFLDSGTLVQPHLAELAAIAAAVAIVRRSGNVGHALAAGLPVYWLGVLLQLA